MRIDPRARERPWPAFLLAKIVGTIFARPYTFRRRPGNGPGPLSYWRKSSGRFSRDPIPFAAGQGTALARFPIGENRRDDFRETLHLSPQARERPWPAFLLAKIVGTIFARPYTFRRGPGNGPGPLSYWRKSSGRFSRDPTPFAAGQGTALARFAMQCNGLRSQVIAEMPACRRRGFSLRIAASFSCHVRTA